MFYCSRFFIKIKRCLRRTLIFYKMLKNIKSAGKYVAVPDAEKSLPI